jgi:hypothetical protein
MEATIATRLAKSRRTRTSTLKTRHCPHYGRNLILKTFILKTFKRHQRLYHKSDGTWILDCHEEEGFMDEGLSSLQCPTSIEHVLGFIIFIGMPSNVISNDDTDAIVSSCPPAMPLDQGSQLDQGINTEDCSDVEEDSGSENEFSGNYVSSRACFASLYTRGVLEQIQVPLDLLLYLLRQFGWKQKKQPRPIIPGSNRKY